MIESSWRRAIATAAVWILVLASVVSWRKGVLYSGGLDPVVVAKAVLAVAALGCAIALRRTTPLRNVLNAAPVLLVASIVAVSLIGAAADGAVVSNLVLAVRIALLGATIVVVISVTPRVEAVSTLLGAMAGVGMVAAATGVPAFLHSRARLGGGIPPLEPNEVATLLLPPAIGLLFVVVRRGLRPVPLILLAVMAGTILATGSRTALLMLAVALLVMILVERRLTPGTSALLLVGALGAYAVLAFSSLLSSIALRGEGIGRLLTLNSRTISWDVVLQTPVDTWAWWVGRGLSVKSVAVVGQYWNTQVFDSSWISSIAQDGAVGTALLVVYIVGTVIAVLRSGRFRALGAALVFTILLRSFLENGLIESSATFTVFFVVALLAWSGPSVLAPRSVAEPTAEADDPRVLRLPAALFKG